MIYTTGTIAINGNTVKGTGTDFSAPLSLIRVGCTLIAISNPIQIFTITEIKNGTELSVTPAANPAIPAGTKFSILLSDSISVDGLAQDVAETLRYYQGKETEIAAAVEWWNEFGGDGQMEQLLADIRAETAKSTANAQKTESDKNAAAASKTAAANSATAAKASQDAAKASETAASNSKTAAATSETNAAKSAADALNYRNQAQAITGSNIGLSSNPRDCPDISGNPSGYLGFLRIMDAAVGWPSVASGERYLSGFICPTLGSVPAFSGLFIGHITGSAYTYKWSESTGPQWARHARKDELDENSSPRFRSVSLKNVSDLTTGWVAGGILSSTLVGTSGSERISGRLYPETNLSFPDQLTMHLKTGDVNKYASLNANGEFIADSFKPKNAEQTRRNINIPTIGGGEVITIEAPSGVEDGKYYPIIINANYYGAYKTGYQIDIVTASGPGNYPMNCNTFTGYVRTGGWSDRKDSGYGYYNRYTGKEIALHSICSSSKDKENLLFVFVEARAFPVIMRLPVGVTAEAPAAQVVYDSGKETETIIPWGVSNPLSSYKNLQVMFDFSMGRCGFYSATTEGLYYICSGGRVGLFNGITVGEEISMTMPKLTINGNFLCSGWLECNGSYTASGATVNKNTYTSRLVDSSGNTIAQSEFRAGETQGQIVVRDLSNSANDKFFSFGKDGTFNAPAAINLMGNGGTGDGVFQLVNLKNADERAYAQLWGNRSDRLSVFELKLDSGFLFYAQKVADGSRILRVNGNIECTSLSQSSDRDLKDNVKIISDATEAIRKMNGYTYTLKENGLPYAGVIAQEVMEAIPEAVGSFTHYGEELQGPTVDGNELREETRYLNVDYAAVTGLLVQVARETDNRVTELEEENASLRANIAAMDERIAKLEALVSQLTGSEK